MTYNLSDDQQNMTFQNYNHSVLDAYDVYNVMKEILLKEDKIDQDKEHFWIIGLANDKHILFIELVSLGSVKATIVEPMNVFRVAVLKGAVSVILVHNHPSGNLSPSQEDINVTDRLIQAGRIINIEVLDHLIISDSFFMSFLKRGIMEKLEKSAKWIPFDKIEEHVDHALRMDRYERNILFKKEKEKTSKKSKIEVAKKMKMKGFSFADIIDLTGLTEKEINKIK